MSEKREHFRMIIELRSKSIDSHQLNEGIWIKKFRPFRYFRG